MIGTEKQTIPGTLPCLIMQGTQLGVCQTTGLQKGLEEPFGGGAIEKETYCGIGIILDLQSYG